MAEPRQPESDQRHAVCFIGGTRYSRPLDSTAVRKFVALSAVASVRVIAFSTDGRPRRFREVADFYLLPCVPSSTARYGLMLLVGPMLALWCILRHRTRIVVAQSPYEGVAGACAKLLARLVGRSVALIVESHGDFERTMSGSRSSSAGGLDRRLMLLGAGFALGRANALRAVSESTRKRIQVWAPGKPCMQFPAWTDLTVFAGGNSPRKVRRQRVILYVGELIPLKGVHVLLEAFACIARDMPDTVLRLVGNATDRKYTIALRRQGETLGLSDRIAFRDHVPQSEVAAEMTEAVVLVLASLSEGLGRVVFEAMACGTPVIGTSVGGVPDMIVHNETGLLVPPGDAASLTDSLRWVLDHPNETAEMARRAREFTRRFFSTEQYVESYARLFKAALGAAETHHGEPVSSG